MDVGMMIRLLQWVPIDDDVWTADALGGSYQVMQFPKGCAVTWTFGNCSRRIADHVGISLHEAQGLAQSDFERIIESSYNGASPATAGSRRKSSMNNNSEILQKVKEVTQTYDKDEVNKQLKNGWVILAVATGQEQTGSNDYTPTFKYSLGRID